MNFWNSFTIPEGATFTFNPADSTITVSGGGTFSVAELARERGLEGNAGKSIFPITVTDKDGNIYRIDEKPGTGGENGTPELVATKLGTQGKPIPDGAVSYKELAADKAIVTFEKGSGKYAFDTWRKEYLTADLIHSKYEQLGDGYVPFKLLPPGKSDVVQASISIKDKDIDPNKLLFKTPKGTEFSYKYENDIYTISLTGGEANDGQEVYALYPNGSRYYNLGKLIVVSYPERTYKAIVVAVNGNTVDMETIKRTLDEVYSPVGITWVLSEDKGFSYNVETIATDGSGFLRSYTPEMLTLNKTYKQYVTDAGKQLADDAVYMFALKSGAMKGKSMAGDMPRGVQFGYLFTEGASTSEVAHTVAHELGHGRLKLEHTFDSDYKIAQGVTDNLMDYAGGMHLAKWQWDLINDPGVVIPGFDGDEDTMLPGLIFKGIEFWDFAEYMYKGYFVNIYSVKANPPSENDEVDVYTLNPHYNVDVDGKDILSYYLAVRTATGRFEYVVGPESYQAFKDNVFNYRWAANWMYMNGTPTESQIRASLGIRSGNLAEYLKGLAGMWGDALSSPDWWVGTAFIYAAPQAKYGKLTAGAQTLMSNLRVAAEKGWYSAFSRFAKAGYKLNLVGENVVIRAEQGLEIARFNSNGYLRPIKYLTAEPDLKVYKLVNEFDEVGYINLSGKEATGRLELWKEVNGNYGWRILQNERGLSNILEKYRVKIFDKVKVIAKDESLPSKIKESFLDSYYYTAENVESITVFRRFGGSGQDQAKLFGSYTSTETVLSRDELAILKKWSNMQFEAEIVVEKGAKLNLGKIAPKAGYSGGADQVLLPLTFPEYWVKVVKDLKTGKVYNLDEFKKAFPDIIYNK